MRQEYISADESTWRCLVWLLRVMLLVQCVGVGGLYLWGPNETESPVYSMLRFNWPCDVGWRGQAEAPADEDGPLAAAHGPTWPEETAQAIDDNGCWASLTAAAANLALPLLGVALFLLIRGEGGQAALRWFWLFLQTPLLLLVFLWQFALAWAVMHNQGIDFADWTLASQAVRYLTPVVLLMAIPGPSSNVLSRSRLTDAVALLRVAVALTFVAHGLKAIYHFAGFETLIIGTADNLLGWELSQQDVSLPLLVIGGVDLLVAGLLLVNRWRIVPLYMALWGLITAASRMTEAGWAAYPDTLLRALNCGAPLAIFLYWTALKRSAYHGPNVTVTPPDEHIDHLAQREPPHVEPTQLPAQSPSS